MTSSFVLSELDKLFKKLNKHYQNLLEDFESEEVHDFRVEIKKLRAFLRLININLPQENQLAISRKLKAFYNSVGQIRNLQLHQKQINLLCEELNFGKPFSYLQVLQEKENNQQKKIHHLSNKIALKHFRKKLEASIPEDFIIAAKDFVLQKEINLHELLSLPELSDKTLHDIRKVLKDILYNYVFIEPYLRGFGYFENEDSLKTFTDKLGDHQDFCVAIQLINNEDESKKEKDILNFLKQELYKRKAKIKIDIAQFLSEITIQMERNEATIAIEI